MLIMNQIKANKDDIDTKYNDLSRKYDKLIEENTHLNQLTTCQLQC